LIAIISAIRMAQAALRDEYLSSIKPYAHPLATLIILPGLHSCWPRPWRRGSHGRCNISCDGHRHLRGKMDDIVGRLFTTQSDRRSIGPQIFRTNRAMSIQGIHRGRIIRCDSNSQELGWTGSRQVGDERVSCSAFWFSAQSQSLLPESSLLP
jgi:hypothetical protein